MQLFDLLFRQFGGRVLLLALILGVASSPVEGAQKRIYILPISHGGGHAPTKSATVNGVISATTSSSITLQSTSGKSVIVNVSGSTGVRINGVVSSLAQLAVGERAIAYVDSSLNASEVNAYTASPPPPPPPAKPATVYGVISATTSSSITLQTTSGQSVIVNVSGSTGVRINGTVSSLAQLAVGERAIAYVDSSLNASEVNAYTPSPALK